MRIVLGCDHRGFPYKARVRDALEADGHTITDLGTWSTDPVDYPDYARLVGVEVREGRAEVGVLICGSGAGVSIAANKLRGVRAALCHDAFTARQSREDDDANVICLGARVVDVDTAIALTRTFVAARFSHEPRHERRLAKVLELEARELAPLEAPAPGQRCDPIRLPAAAEALERLERLDAGARIWRRDTSLWSDDAAVRAVIEHRLGWLALPETMPAHVAELVAFASEIRGDGITDVVLLGMGGSSLAAEVLAHTFAAPGSPALTVLDTTDPGAIRDTLGRLKLPHTLFLVSSKSGTTTEMLALYRYFRGEVAARVAHPGAHFVAITDAGTPLERLAGEAGFRRIFLNPADVGGRFSALSFFGLVPGALIGVDIAALLGRATAMARACGPTVPVADNPALMLAAVLGGFALRGRDKVTLVLPAALSSLGAWLEQLLTESTGKQGRGLVVIHEEPLGPPAVYGSDRVFVSLELGREEAATAHALDALDAAGHPVLRLRLADRFDVGGEFFRWEMATAAVGALLGINPFDEPNVAQAKDATQAALATFKERGRLPEWPVDSLADLARTLGQARPGDYLAILAYLTPQADATAALGRLRTLIRDRARLATTVGYGPRYLHSTGQLHKGGPPTPIVIVLTAEDRDDLPIPGERYGFGTLKMAQALGDLATLRATHRRALWLPLGDRPVEALSRLTAALTRMLG